MFFKICLYLPIRYSIFHILKSYVLFLGELKEQAALSGRKDLHQSKGAARLFTRVNKMLKGINAVVDKLEVSI